MRFMIVVKPQFFVPPDMIPGMIAGFNDWWARYQGKWESAGFFAEGNGGGGICTVADTAEFHQMMLEWPFTPFSQIDTYALVDVDVALGQWQAAVDAMTAAGSTDE